jgi:hypothetical protein
MGRLNYLPLGSQVVLKGDFRKTMIISRGLLVDINGEKVFFEYAGCQYPEGLVGDKVLYFNHEDISQIVFEGYSDDENKCFVNNINDMVEKANVVKGNTLEIKKKMGDN